MTNKKLIIKACYKVHDALIYASENSTPYNNCVNDALCDIVKDLFILEPLVEKCRFCPLYNKESRKTCTSFESYQKALGDEKKELLIRAKVYKEYIIKTLEALPNERFTKRGFKAIIWDYSK